MPTLNGKAWMDFRLLDIFTHIKGNQNNMASLEDGATPVVSAKNTNNGYKGFAKPLNGKRPFAGHCLTIKMCIRDRHWKPLKRDTDGYIKRYARDVQPACEGAWLD